VTRALALAALVACGGSTRTVPDPRPDPRPVPPTTAPAPQQTAEPQELVFPDEPFRATQPTAGPPRPFQVPAAKTFTLETGLRVYLVEQHDLPLVSMDLRFAGGVRLSPAKKAGLANICVTMLTEGTDKLDKLQYAAALASRASTIRAYVSADMMGLTVSTLTKHLPATFAQLAATVREPAFRASDHERLVKRQIEVVRQWKVSPPYLHWRVHTPVFYGSRHPLGVVTTEASLGRITPADCKQFAASYLRPSGAELFVVGDLTEAQLRSLFAAELAGWRGAPKPITALPAPRSLPGRIFFVHLAGVPQSFVSVMHHLPGPTTGDYLARTIIEGVFGGSFSSRINMNVREDKAYAYGAQSAQRGTKQHGMFETITSARTDATYQTVLEFHREIVALTSGKAPITSAELTSEQQAKILGLPARFATNDDALLEYRELVYRKLPLDHFNAYSARLLELTPDRVNAAAKQYLAPENAIYLVAGDGNAPMIVRTTKDEPYVRNGKPVTLREALVELARQGTLGKGAFVELDLDGRPVR
jgi:zinc protease